MLDSIKGMTIAVLLFALGNTPRLLMRYSGHAARAVQEGVSQLTPTPTKVAYKNPSLPRTKYVPVEEFRNPNIWQCALKETGTIVCVLWYDRLDNAFYTCTAKATDTHAVCVPAKAPY